MLEISKAQMREIRRHLQRSYPEEGCGLLWGVSTAEGKKVGRAQPMNNETPGRAGRRYLISSDELRKAGRRSVSNGMEVLGFFHSHPDTEAVPSDFDREHAWPWYSYLIVSVRRGSCEEQLCWRLREDRSGFEPEEVRIVEER